MKKRPNIPPVLLWEYDYDTFNFDRSYKIVIERVLERGSKCANIPYFKLTLYFRQKLQP